MHANHSAAIEIRSNSSHGRYASGHDEVWTRALKFVLTNLKWCLAWVCKQAM